ncbi:hypothetical protein H6F98_06180 [Microcoleus sp. FACHB-SPT15]|uniref:hypothetical protein n=1 Tax=Microcoleus sp. FACHB-SPT15 TaxID=2692830 RepID=UPI001786B4E6|nr:hypothetical protein [Microcoleus sp. FACHB-SPT15]MBD1805039.1 hypothetical protein [Microcoleus sp. FACHB-SPT15]
MVGQNKVLFFLWFIPLLALGCFLGFYLGDLINVFSVSIPKLNFYYNLAVCLLFILFLEALIKKNIVWKIPSILIYITVAVWYLTETVYTPENLTKFSTEILENCYLQIILFLGSFRFFVPQLSKKIVLINSLPHQAKVITTSINPARLLTYLSAIWLVLLMYGISRMKGDIFGALFPISSRTGGHMWGRAAGAAAGSSGFLVSSASYIYILVCSFFGILLLLQTRQSVRIINLVLILISWPYFILMGSRNVFLAVALPSVFSYALTSKHKWWVKIIVLGAVFIAINYILSLVIAYRNIGFASLLDSTSQSTATVSEQKHLGLNMLEELSFINSFYQQGTLHINYGSDYLAQFLNFVPRAIWPGKPLVGIDYAIARGFADSTRDIGVFATISTGLIGQGLINFGPYIGPLAPAFLMALWAAFLARLWSQRYSPLRLCLFLAALGITLNLGREITLLVLWPIVFGYGLVRFLENLNKKKLRSRELNYY